jgi:mycofactocin precursor
MDIRTRFSAPTPEPVATVPAAALQARSAAADPASSGNPPAPRPLDLRGMAPPAKLSEARLEDLTIDGICGVY